jgi:hypothetical protein
MQRTQSRRTFSNHLTPFDVGGALDDTPQLLRIIRHVESLLLCGVITASYGGAWLMDAATTVVHRVSRRPALQDYSRRLSRGGAPDRAPRAMKREQS